ncbi:MAG: ABC transporter ATP-binding protein, partial [Tepidisphaeraceae bacterium]
GVVFQHPALDKQLTVEENLRFHGKLFGLSIRDIKRRTAELLARFNLADRAHELVASLSGGMRRKVELAKAILATPKLLLLDEPSTGLDVAARIELWQLLRELRQAGDLTIVLTTHLMDEADRCDHLAIIDQGNLLVVDTPDALKDALGGDVITFVGRDLPQLQSVIQQKLGLSPQLIEDRLRIERPQAHLFVPQVIEAAPGLIDSISVGRPTLDDVFVHRTGRRLHATALPT